MFEIFKEHSHNWRQIMLLARTELQKTYKGALLGTGWALVKPLLTLFVYWFAFEFGIRSGGSFGGVSRFTFMLVGFVPWFFINDAILMGSKSIRANKQFVVKMKFPVSTITTFTLLSRLYVHFMLLVPMIAYLWATGSAPTVYTLQIFIYMPLMFIFFEALTWTTATMSAFSIDFLNLVNSIVTCLFWLSGILWDASTMSPVIKYIMYINPITYIVDGYRYTFISSAQYNSWFFLESPARTALFLAELMVVMLLGMYNYKRLRKQLPDVL